MKSTINVFLLCVTIVVAVLILAGTYENRNKSLETINVTGLGEEDFKSDLIVWSGSFTRKDKELKTAYDLLKIDNEKIREYLKAQGVESSQMVFSAVDINKDYDYSYDNEGNRHTQFSGYRLTQRVEIESKDVEKIEKVAREVTEIINQGVEFYSNPPQYYYTGLSQLKIEMIAAATEDARKRAEEIAGNAGAEIGELRNAQMGIFQIVAQNSNEDYSWGGTYNTSSKMKTATITMKLEFGID